MKISTVKFGFLQLFPLGLLLTTVGMPGYASEIENLDNDMQAKRAIIAQLKGLNLEELIEVETFNPKAMSAARKIQKLSETAAALFVLTQEDLRRAGVTRISEALRMLPGVQVARIDANKWAISARGLNGPYASKLLVMIDGRSVYTPLRSEVNWDVQDLLIEDIARIEVIRGPGASLWGANAVNGVINIITKSAQETQGNLITTYAGKGEEKGIVGVQHGGTLENGLAYRVYGKFYDHDHFLNAEGQAQHDDWQMHRGGFRLDWKATDKDSFSLQSDAYDGTANQTVLVSLPVLHFLNDEVELEGANVLGRWERHLDQGDMILQAYYDHTYREDSALGESRDTYDIDFQHRWPRNDTQEYIWGLGFRQSRDNIANSPVLFYNSAQRQSNLFSAFVQGEFLLQPVRLTVGSKFEHNNYTGWEIQPTLRALWNLNAQHSFWAAVSRAVRTPSRSDVDANTETIDVQRQIKLSVRSVHNVVSETLQAYELGYRFAPSKRLLVDTTAFVNRYDKLRNIEQIGFDFFSLPPTIILENNNKMYGEVYGLELALHWQVLETWKLVGTYSYLNVQLHLHGPSNLLGESEEGDSPRNQASLRSLWTLPYKMELDGAWYYVDNVPNQHTKRYHRFDVRFGWQPKPAWELSLGARNLFDSQHREFGRAFNGNIIFADEVPRAVYMQLKYRF
jgi:iron complex outermembrane receptor protein